MWGKPGEAEPNQNQPAQNTATPRPAQANRDNSSRTVVGKSMKIIGEISSDEELWLEGSLEGKLELRNRLTIGPESNVKADIKAEEIVVFGTVRGNVEAQGRIELRAGATIVGDIKTAGIVIEDGAYFKGGIDISRAENGVAAPKAAGASAGQKR
jgi:cytoskeletal protein CcmA (bactofilin family)